MTFERNRVEFVGNLGRDPHASVTANGNARLFFSVAANRTRKDANGEKVKETTWFPCVYFGKGADAVAPYLVKGKGVFIEGRIQSRTMKTKGGEEYEGLEVFVENLQLLGDRAEGGSRPAPVSPKSADEDFDFGELADDTVPF
jgi:single-strand DNA-binding protein